MFPLFIQDMKNGTICFQGNSGMRPERTNNNTTCLIFVYLCTILTFSISLHMALHELRKMEQTINSILCTPKFLNLGNHERTL